MSTTVFSVTCDTKLPAQRGLEAAPGCPESSPEVMLLLGWYSYAHMLFLRLGTSGPEYDQGIIGGKAGHTVREAINRESK